MKMFSTTTATTMKKTTITAVLIQSLFFSLSIYPPDAAHGPRNAMIV